MKKVVTAIERLPDGGTTGKRVFLRSCLFFVLVLFGCNTTRQLHDPDPHPNIVLIVADDLGWNDAGFMGNRYHETPRLDELAAEGAVFLRAYANAPNCAPSRASLVSGQYPPRHGIYTVGNPARGKSENRKLIPSPNRTELDPEIATIAEILHQNGYRTGFFGKWHLGGSGETLPTARGYDINIGGSERGSPASYFSPYQNPHLEDGPDGEYLTDRIGREAIRFIENEEDKPFFAHVSFFSVHTPIQGKPEKVRKYDQITSPHERASSGYAAMVESLDENVGLILDALETHGLANNTVVIFMSDNGPYYPVTSAFPLRGSKGMLYEGGIRIPIVFRWPGKIAAGARITERVIGTDIFPTLLETTGILDSSNQAIDGVSLYSLVRYGTGLDRSSLFWHFPAYLEPYGGMDQLWRQTPASAVIRGDWKLIESFETGKTELFNLSADPGEQNDLTDRYPEKTRLLLAELRRWRQETNAPVPTQRNPDYVGFD